MNSSSPFASVDRKEKARSKIVSLIFIIYWLLIFEGALRKWVFPEYQKILFFIRDPFVLIVYWVAFKNEFFPRRSKPLIAAIAIGILITPLMIIQLAVENMDPLVLMYGWRNYFLYIPLAFIIGECIKTADLAKLFKQSLILSIPMAILAYFQFLSPPGSFINKGVDENSLILVVTGDIVRTTGTFSFTAGHSFFVGSIMTMLLFIWLIPIRSWRSIRRTALLWAATAATATLISLSGSRTVFFLVILAVLATLTAGFTMQRSQRRAMIAPLILIIISAAIFIMVFPTAFEAMSERQINAELEEPTLSRAFSSFYNFLDVLPDLTALGYGIGFGTGGGSLLVTGISQFTLVEDEWSRILLETGPFFGFSYIFLRIYIVWHLFINAIKSARLSNNPLPLILLGFIGMTLLTGSITMQGTINGYGWLFCGFCLAAIKMPPITTLNQAR